MLQSIRDNSQGLIAKILIGFIVVIFVLFGFDSLFRVASNVPPASVNGEDITDQELYQQQRLIASRFGADMNSDMVKKLALDQLLDEKIFLQAADKMELYASKDAVNQEIIENPSFQTDGVYDQERLVAILRDNNTSASVYIDALQQKSIQDQLGSAFQDSNFVTNSELEKIAELVHETRSISVLEISLEKYKQSVAISDEEVQQYYDENQLEFAIPEKVSVEYIELKKEDLFKEISVSESDIKAEYDSRASEFKGAERRRASHILVEVSDEQSKDKALEVASDIKKRLDAGEDFAKLAKELSADTVSAEEGGDLDFSDGETFPEEFEAALAKLKLKEVSEPVFTDSGYHLIKLTEVDKPEFQPFEELKASIERSLKEGQVEDLFLQRTEILAESTYESDDLVQPSSEAAAEIKTSELFSQDTGEGIAANPQVREAAFSEQVFMDKRNSDQIDISDTHIVFLRLKSHEESKIKPLTDVKTEINDKLVFEKAKVEVTSKGQAALASLSEGALVKDKIAADFQSEWKKHDDIRRNQPSVNRKILESSFAIRRPDNGSIELHDGVLLDNGNYVLITLHKVTAGDIEKLSERERESLKKQIDTDIGNRSYESFRNALYADADVRRTQ